MTPINPLGVQNIPKKREKKNTIKFWVLSDSNLGPVDEMSVYHPLSYRGFHKNRTI